MKQPDDVFGGEKCVCIVGIWMVHAANSFDFFCLYQHEKEESGSSVVATVFTVIAVVLFVVQLYLMFTKLPAWVGEAQAQLADKLARIQ